MQERSLDDARQRDEMMRSYVQGVAGSEGGGSAASEVAHLAELHRQGVLTDAEFEQAKAKALS